MRNLLLFIQRFRVFFTFLFLFALSLTILINNNSYQRSGFLNSSNRVVGKMYAGISLVRTYFNLSKENDRLLEENARLKSVLRESYYVDTITAVKVNDSVYKQQYEYIAARVINNSVDRKFNYITLNRGSKHGVQRFNGVICDQGVVGVVVKVSDHFCTVMSLLNSKTNITPRIDSFMYYGEVKWDGSSIYHVALTQINRFAPVRLGQKVYTSGYSRYYPEGVLIGEIDRINLEEGSNFYDIDVRLSTDFTALSSVYIVRNLFKHEADELEEVTKKEDEDGR